MKVIGYLYITDETPSEQEQREKIEAWAEDRHEIVAWPWDRGKARHKRPALNSAVERVNSGDADLIVVSHGNRLGSVFDAGSWIAGSGERILILDPPMDAQDHSSLADAYVIDRLWRPPVKRLRRRVRAHDPKVVDRIVKEKGGGLSVNDITAGLNLDAVPTVTGKGKWSAQTVHAILKDPERAKT